MTLRDQMAADLSRVFLNVDEFAEAALFYPAAGASSFSITLAPADPSDAFAVATAGVDEQRDVQATGRLSLIRAGILAIEGTVRDPARGDLVVFASGVYAGTWVMRSFAADVGDGVVLNLHYEAHHNIAAKGAVVTP